MVTKVYLSEINTESQAQIPEGWKNLLERFLLPAVITWLLGNRISKFFIDWYNDMNMTNMGNNNVHTKLSTNF